LLAVNVALVTLAIFKPPMNHSTVLPILLMMTSRQAKPTEPTAMRAGLLRVIGLLQSGRGEPPGKVVV
jgi:hypothetical protein